MLEALVALVAGLLIGSFLNVCVYRMPRDLSVVAPRSYCPACEHPIAWYDNIPIASFALLGGRCRHCGKPIPIRYLLVEALTAALFVVVVLLHGPSLVSVALCTFCALMIGLVFSDLEERILPDEFTLGGIALGLLFAYVAPFQVILLSLFLPHWTTDGCRCWNPRLRRRFPRFCCGAWARCTRRSGTRKGWAWAMSRWWR